MGSLDAKGTDPNDWQEFAKGLLKSFEGHHDVHWADAPELPLPKKTTKPKSHGELLLAIADSAEESDREFLLRSADLLCNSYKWTDGTVPEHDGWDAKEIGKDLEYFAFLSNTRAIHVPLDRRIRMAHRYLLLIALKAGTPDTTAIRNLLLERLSHVALT
ncbi:MAG: hypothetical protein JWM46_331 [Candidatus Kaiserbacteria bacterium]|nr:hypothetical protein [Candidatus Kaiserbacteria bacterium]